MQEYYDIFSINLSIFVEILKDQSCIHLLLKDTYIRVIVRQVKYCRESIISLLKYKNIYDYVTDIMCYSIEIYIQLCSVLTG